MKFPLLDHLNHPWCNPILIGIYDILADFTVGKRGILQMFTLFVSIRFPPDILEKGKSIDSSSENF